METFIERLMADWRERNTVRVYERIRDKLSGDFTCYYSRSWHEADDHGAEFDGEADFIVAHAEYGLLFLEVKGGRVSCRESDGQWLTEDRDGNRAPAYQLKTTMRRVMPQGRRASRKNRSQIQKAAAIRVAKVARIRPSSKTAA